MHRIRFIYAFGNSIHKANEVNFSQKVETKVDLPTEEVKQIFSETFDEEISDVDKNDFALADPGKMKDGGLKLIEHYQKFYAPRIMPVAVEQRIKVKFKNYDYGLSCKIDIYDIDESFNQKTTKQQVNGKVPKIYHCK
jgi:galactokinase